MDVIAKRNIFLGFSGIVVVASLVVIFIFGLKPGIDLVGGTQWNIAVQNGDANEVTIKETMLGVSDREVMVKTTSDGTYLIRMLDTNEELHQSYFTALTAKFGEVEEKSFSSIGPAIGSELRAKAIWAVILVLFGISVYIAFAFRKVSHPIQSWKYGVSTLLTLFHDVIIPAGLLAILGHIAGVEIDTNFIVALLVVMGFSVHDTIVVFDRIRENILLSRGKNINLKDIINFSIKETMVRSINTSLTLVLVLLAMIFFGPSPLFYFVLTIMVGTIFGTYSSIFVASPLLYIWNQQSVKKSV
ncbi:MAG: protein translocase subunit SecF [Patescibacteria group bacterium]